MIDSNKTLFETLITLQKHKGGAVAVLKNNKLAGIFTTGDLNRLIKAKKKFNYNDKIINFISKLQRVFEVFFQFRQKKLKISQMQPWKL